jgi:hypothetical protein
LKSAFISTKVHEFLPVIDHLFSTDSALSFVEEVVRTKLGKTRDLVLWKKLTELIQQMKMIP